MLLQALAQLGLVGGQSGSRARKPVLDPSEVRPLVMSVEDERCEMSLTLDGMDRADLDLNSGLQFRVREDVARRYQGTDRSTLVFPRHKIIRAFRCGARQQSVGNIRDRLLPSLPHPGVRRQFAARNLPAQKMKSSECRSIVFEKPA